MNEEDAMLLYLLYDDYDSENETARMNIGVILGDSDTPNRNRHPN
jgi:hypothetical protein